MSKSMSADGTRKNIDSNDNKCCPQLRNITQFNYSGPSAAGPFFLILTLYLIFSLGCFTSSNAQPYQTNLNDISWARFVAPSPLAMSANTFNDYEGQNSDADHSEGIIEDAPEKGITKDVSNLKHIVSWLAIVQIIILHLKLQFEKNSPQITF